MTFEYRLDEQSEATQRVQNEGGVIPGSEADETRLIQAHLDSAIATLKAADISSLGDTEAKRRAAMIEALQTYKTAGTFPHNDDFPGSRIPYFVDSAGTRCAMGHLIDVSGHAHITDFVRVNDNHAKVQDLAENPALGAWLVEHGMTAEEAALVQPSYGGIPAPPPRALRAPPRSDAVEQGLERAYRPVEKALDRYRWDADYVQLDVGTVENMSRLLANGMESGVARSYAQEVNRLRGMPLVPKGTPYQPLGDWPDANESSQATGIVLDHLDASGKTVEHAFTNLMAAHQKAIARFFDGQTYITEAELRDVKTAMAEYRGAVDGFQQQAGMYWQVVHEVDQNQRRPWPPGVMA